MKILLIGLVGLTLITCQKSEVTSEFTGRQATYGLVQASSYPVNGTVTFKERKDGATTVVIQLKGTTGVDQLPVHLHPGDITANGSGTVALLNMLKASTGVSTTIISTLADGSKVSYSDLLKTSAYLNVHASSSGPESAIILVAGNIGSNSTNSFSARMQVGNCTTTNK
ncbi:MAG: hypothetical protein OJF59_003274 [Cytophagales bacterium]|jgi:hypothetical protein|nr:hypothetical protein [Bacteroidota bacterium]MBS1982194.1 hypothetical protein [Bacteroidota bacterium]WHZ09518.1 MAG: hypothetical protein OJF59_003274 [Cytophagales bacterium]